MRCSCMAAAGLLWSVGMDFHNMVCNGRMWFNTQLPNWGTWPATGMEALSDPVCIMPMIRRARGWAAGP